MKTPIVLFAALILLAGSTRANAQAAVTSQPTQAQQQPCTTASSPTSAAPTSNSRPTYLDRLKKNLDKRGADFTKRTGVPIPTTDEVGSVVPPKTGPCSPKVAAPASPSPNTQSVPVQKLPPDVSITIRCNPVVAAPKGAPGGAGGFVVPDPHAYGLPEPNQFEADNATPDINAKTPCFALKVDPKTNRFFIAQ